MEITVVVDGGGSGSRLAAFNEQSEMLASTKSGPASLTLGEQDAWHSISAGLASLATQLDDATGARDDHWLPDKLLMGLAGVLQTERRERFLALLPATLEAVLVTDGEAQLLGAAGGQAGICLAVGTGSVVHWQDENGEFGMAGGWGFPVADEASGAWLGMAAIRAYLHHFDTLRNDSSRSEIAEDTLMLELRAILGSQVSDIQRWTTCTSPTKLATLVPPILSAAQQGSAPANALLRSGAAACDTLLELAPPALPVYLVGGLAQVYSKRLRAALQPRLQPPHGSVFDGLLSLAK